METRAWRFWRTTLQANLLCPIINHHSPPASRLPSPMHSSIPPTHLWTDLLAVSFVSWITFVRLGSAIGSGPVYCARTFVYTTRCVSCGGCCCAFGMRYAVCDARAFITARRCFLFTYTAAAAFCAPLRTTVHTTTGKDGTPPRTTLPLRTFHLRTSLLPTLPPACPPHYLPAAPRYLPPYLLATTAYCLPPAATTYLPTHPHTLACHTRLPAYLPAFHLSTYLPLAACTTHLHCHYLLPHATFLLPRRTAAPALSLPPPACATAAPCLRAHRRLPPPLYALRCALAWRNGSAYSYYSSRYARHITHLARP